MLFKDRHDAGVQLSSLLQKYKGAKEAVVLGITRGGVPVAYEVAKALKLPLNVIVIRKIGAPGNEELAIGAINEKGEGVFNDNLIAILGVSSDYLKREIEKEKRIAAERLAFYRGSHPAFDVKGKTVILIDDGIATGASIKAAIKALRLEEPQKIVLAVPVAPSGSLKDLGKEVEEIISLSTPSFFESVGSSYKFFDQITDKEILRLLSSER